MPDQGLPPAARARLAEIKSSGTWSSALSTAEFAAIRSAGFEPVGQVLGAAVYNIGQFSDDSCPTYGSRDDPPARRQSRTAAVYTSVSGSGSATAYAPLVNTLYEARRRALRRLSAECDALGGHGVVGVHLVMGSFPGGGYEFRALGTAVTAPGAVQLRTPFTSDLSGQEFAKLIMAGWVPVSLVLGISIGVRHDDWVTAGQASVVTWNTEVSGYTELVNRTRRDARNELMLDVSRVQGQGVVIKDIDLSVGEHPCHGVGQQGRRDHWAEATMIGTAVTRFIRGTAITRLTRGRPAYQPPGTVPVLSLDPQRRRDAGITPARHGHERHPHPLAPETRDNNNDGDVTEEQ